MEEEWKKKNGGEASDKEIVFSQAIKAGKRIYYLDVKNSRKDEMYLAITESKKIINGEGEDAQVSFEKHKIFLYQEDFEKFMNGLQQSIRFIQDKQGGLHTFPRNEKKGTAAEPEETFGPAADKEETHALNDGEIKIDIDF